MMIGGFHSSPLGVILGAVTSAVFSCWSATSISGSSIAPAHQVPGQTTRSREAGVREAIGRLEDSVERCCVGRTVESPAPVCKCGLRDSLSDLLQGFALGAGSFLLAVASWACRCCGGIGHVSLCRSARVSWLFRVATCCGGGPPAGDRTAFSCQASRGQGAVPWLTLRSSPRGLIK